MSFRQGFNEFRVSEFPRLSSDAVPIIAPLWADYNFRMHGNVYYRATTDPPTLARAKKLIAESNPLNFNDFSPTLGFVVTWASAVLLTRALDNTAVRI